MLRDAGCVHIRIRRYCHDPDFGYLKLAVFPHVQTNVCCIMSGSSGRGSTILIFIVAPHSHGVVLSVLSGCFLIVALLPRRDLRRRR
jgi:hypothetical protein